MQRTLQSALRKAGDPNSLANLAEARVKHIHWNVAVDFAAKILRGSTDLDVVALKDSVSEVVLDTSFLDIQHVHAADGSPLKFEIGPRHEKFGSPLTVRLPVPLKAHDATKIRVQYATTPECTAIQWLEPSQTTGKTHPYLFTQCQAIHARSLLPCQDSPLVKFTYSANVHAAQPLTALMSAVPSGFHDSLNPSERRFDFEQKTAIPSYLMALAVGNLKGVRVGPRSTVWSEPETVDAAAHEFVDTENFVATGEQLLTPYSWGIYDLLLLPGSFPYGGMENPCLTFVTPTLLAGDRSLVDVVAHEIAHSWMGNLVTTANWEHFWLNEGFTVFVERKIVGRLHGEPSRHFSSLIGHKALQESVRRFGETNPLTALIPDLDGIDPDDSFSSVPYEKGFNLLFYLEQLVGGPTVFEPYLKAHVERFSHKSITSGDWFDFLMEYFGKHHPDSVERLKTVDWDAWLLAPGMPKISNTFDTQLADACIALASRWDAARHDSSFDWAQGSMDAFSALQKVFFLEKLLETPALPHAAVQALNATYGFSAIRNAEITYRWQMLALKSKYEPVFTEVVRFITLQGRMKFVRPLYRALKEANGALAKATFESSQSFYHPIAASMIAKDLAGSD